MNGALTPSGETILYDFSEGVAQIGIQNEKDGGYDEGYIDKAGELIIPSRFEDTWDFSDGYAYVETKQGKYMFIDKTRQVVLELAFEAYVPYFSEGLVVVKVNGKYGYADKNWGTRD